MRLIRNPKLQAEQKERPVPPIRSGFKAEPIKKIIRQKLARGITDSVQIMEDLYSRGYNVPLLLVEDFLEELKR